MVTEHGVCQGRAAAAACRGRNSTCVLAVVKEDKLSGRVQPPTARTAWSSSHLHGLHDANHPYPLSTGYPNVVLP